MLISIFRIFLSLYLYKAFKPFKINNIEALCKFICDCLIFGKKLNYQLHTSDKNLSFSG
jgi:hypothetical protein